MAGIPRRRKLIGHRRRVEDEGNDEGGPDHLDFDEDSLTEGTLSDDNDAADDSDTSNIDEASPTSPNARKPANGAAKHPARPASQPSADGGASKPVSDTDMMLHGLSSIHPSPPIREMHFEDMATASVKSSDGPIVVSSASVISSSSATKNPAGPGMNRRRQEHEDYKRRRDEDPSFVPNRGAFFMHDHRHAGPAGNGFRPFGRGRGRGGRGGIGGPFAPINQLHRPQDPTTNSQWTHDMHDAVVEPLAPTRPRHHVVDEGPPNGNGFIPTCASNPTPINRMLSTEKHVGNATVRVFLPDMEEAKIIPGMPVKQYTKLPDHRPPLRRDKPVRISLPNNPPRYIFPAVDRSFIFIPRAMRPNQQRLRGKPRSTFGSVGGFSRRTSVFGGSYYGSVYSPSVAMSRRSSIVDRDYMFSPTGSVMSRPPIPVENPRPVVRLPPAPRPDIPVAAVPVDPGFQPDQSVVSEASISDLPQPQTYPLPQKPTFRENQPTSLPMHQPRPQKNISVADIESPTLIQGPQAFHQPFHQQVPMQMSNGFTHEHSRQASYPSQHSTGTPLSQIPERAVHAVPFQPNTYGQQPFYQQQAYQMQPQQGYYYPGNYNNPNGAPSAAAPAFVPGPQGPMGGFTPQTQPEQPVTQPNSQSQVANSNLVAQEVNGMVYYYDASQLPPVSNYPNYSAPQNYPPSVMGMGGMVTPSPDGFYYPQQAPGMVYYPQ